MRLLAISMVLMMLSLSLRFFVANFPLKYREEVLTISRELKIDPALLIALIKVESSFNPYAVSPAGAVGLTQVMPHTAKWISEKLGISGKLGKPSDNIKIGASYLKYLMDKYGDLEKALKAYNIGPKAYENGMNSEAAERYLRKIEITYRAYQILYRW